MHFPLHSLCARLYITDRMYYLSCLTNSGCDLMWELFHLFPHALLQLYYSTLKHNIYYLKPPMYSYFYKNVEGLLEVRFSLRLIIGNDCSALADVIGANCTEIQFTVNF